MPRLVVLVGGGQARIQHDYIYIFIIIIIIYYILYIIYYIYAMIYDIRAMVKIWLRVVAHGELTRDPHLGRDICHFVLLKVII
jgi:hypothetical protein